MKKILLSLAFVFVTTLTFGLAPDKVTERYINIFRQFCTIYVVDEIEGYPDAAGIYNSENDTIHLDCDYPGITQEAIQTTLFHEFAHFLTKNKVPENLETVKYNDVEWEIYVEWEVIASEVDALVYFKLYGREYPYNPYYDIIGGPRYREIVNNYYDLINEMVNYELDLITK